MEWFFVLSFRCRFLADLAQLAVYLGHGTIRFCIDRWDVDIGGVIMVLQ